MSIHPIIFVDNDEDEDMLIGGMLRDLAPTHPLLRFSTAAAALAHLKVGNSQPFLILCEINLPGMNGLELRKALLADEKLRKKAIPFIFLTNPISPVTVEEVYELQVQGLLEKKLTLTEQRHDLQLIIAYWSHCRRPNT
ncbi:response regulator [Spirosoma rhododendri]|uniref:Response regulator n=1 Tax=Spirosoma rhododendri TaxID=2728024 RepID=A0A7L5DSM9_9BACT|nr:response regulator [Spirosoma rhododendri]QJD79578.1 response regulator [Spirosoma rhododendri]